MEIAGIPWWTTDIGGFHGGNINDEGLKMRPPFYDYPDDEKARNIYLSEDSWKSLIDGRHHTGPEEINLSIPVGRIPAFFRDILEKSYSVEDK